MNIGDGVEVTSRKSYEGASLGLTDLNGKMVSSKITCREMIILRDDRSRHW